RFVAPCRSFAKLRPPRIGSNFQSESGTGRSLPPMPPNDYRDHLENAGPRRAVAWWRQRHWPAGSAVVEQCGLNLPMDVAKARTEASMTENAVEPRSQSRPRIPILLR